MNELDALKAEANAALAELKAHGATITADGYEPTAEDKAKFDDLEKSVKTKQEAIAAIQAKSESESDRNERLNRLKKLGEFQTKLDDFNYRSPNEESDFARADQDKDLGIAMSAWGRFGCQSGGFSVSAEEAEAGKRLGVNIAAGEFRVTNPDILRANARQIRTIYANAASAGMTRATVQLEDEYLAADTDALDSRVPERAGYLNRPTEFLNTLEMNMIAYGGILAAPITIMITDHYEDVVETYGDDTTHTGRQIGEAQTIGTTLTPNFANITWKSWDFTSDDIPVMNRQLERSRFALPTYIAQMLGERLGRVQGTKFTTGTGANTPQGIVVACTAGGTSVTTAASLVIGFDDVTDLQYALDPIYWGAPGSGYMMNPKVLPLLKKIKDGNGNPIFQLGKEGAARSQATLNGDPIYWNNDMTAPVAGAWTAADKAMLYGQYSRFVVRRGGGGMPVLIRDETTNRRTLGTIFTALMNFDSRLRDYGANPLAELRIKA